MKMKHLLSYTGALVVITPEYAEIAGVTVKKHVLTMLLYVFYSLMHTDD